MRNAFIIALLTVLFTSCGTTSKQLIYHVAMTSVESPANAKVAFGETKVVKQFTNEEGQQIENYQYKDNYVDFRWYVGLTQLDFTMRNNSGHTITVNWDEVSYVDIWGSVSRVMHKGVKFIDREKPQGSLSVPNTARISDVIIPNDNVYLEQGGLYTIGGWKQKALIPCYYDTQEAMDADIARGAHVGKSIRVLFPIYIEGVRNDYVFEFTAEQILNGKR